jgi:hypothetical protein
VRLSSIIVVSSLLAVAACQSGASNPPAPTGAVVRGGNPGGAAPAVGSGSGSGAAVPVPTNPDCARWVARSKGAIEVIGKELGKPPAAGYDKALTDGCSAAIAAGHPDPSVACVLGAKDDDAVLACWRASMAKYKARSRQVEATLQLDKLGRAAKAIFEKTGAWPQGEAPLTPTKSCCAQNLDDHKRCALVPSDWDAPIWKTLGYSVGMPFQFQYAYKSFGNHFQATAVADLDCDGHPVTFQLTGLVEGGKPRMTLVEPE